VNPEALLRRIADGAAHSGQVLAGEFGVTRAAIWKQIDKLREWDLQVHAAAGNGYRLDRPVDLLDAAALRTQLRPGVGLDIGSIEVFTALASTNRYLLERGPPPPGRLDACLAEFQSAGRGRRGRVWSAPLGGCLCLSVSWTFAETPPDLSALSLAVGAAARRVLRQLTGIEAQLKWPNDLVWEAHKLGGILVELSAEAHGGCHLVAGLGINVDIAPDRLASLSDWPAGAVDLRTATAGQPPARTALAARLIEAFAALAADYALHGFAPFRDEWLAADYLLGRQVYLEDAAGQASGRACGIDADGALLVEVAPGRRRRIISGDVRVRAMPA
jgi:BirA family biotin operon repressor/biotin-[acetyl-CoA-carboxylase] ligase